MPISKILELETSPENPFEKDQLGREEIADGLTILLNNVDTPFVLTINSSWGTGKTTFLRMWDKKLKNQGYKCFIYNAWQNDFVDDPFISFMGELDNFQNEKTEAWKETKNGAQVFFENWFAPLAKIALISQGADPTTTSAVTAGLGGHVKDFFKHFKKMGEDLSVFKDKFKKYVKSLNEASENEIKPFIVFIDELDRCKPSFAIQLLERLKHIFDIPGIVFVLAMDMEQLGHSLKTIYGNNMNVSGYLRRFFDQEFLLPPSSPEKYPEFLINHYGLESSYLLIQQTKREFLETFVPLSKSYKLGLRDIEKIFFQFNLFLRTQGTSWDPQIIAYLLILKISHHVEYQKILENLQSGETGLTGLDIKTMESQVYKGEDWWENLNVITHIWNLDNSNFQKIARTQIQESNKTAPIDPALSTPTDIRNDQMSTIYRYFLDNNKDFKFPLLRYHIQKLEFLDYFKLPESLDTEPKSSVE